MGSSFSVLMYTLSSALKEEAFTPGSHFTVNICYQNTDDTQTNQDRRTRTQLKADIMRHPAWTHD